MLKEHPSGEFSFKNQSDRYMYAGNGEEEEGSSRSS